MSSSVVAVELKKNSPLKKLLNYRKLQATLTANVLNVSQTKNRSNLNLDSNGISIIVSFVEVRSFVERRFMVFRKYQRKTLQQCMPIKEQTTYLLVTCFSVWMTDMC